MGTTNLGQPKPFIQFNQPYAQGLATAFGGSWAIYERQSDVSPVRDQTASRPVNPQLLFLRMRACHSLKRVIPLRDVEGV